MYTVDYFIDKFSKIPEDKWCFGQFMGPDNRRCAAGHCGVRDKHVDRGGVAPAEALALVDILSKLPITGIAIYDNDHQKIFNTITVINDGYSQYNQETPKQRILAALQDIKKMQDTEIVKEQPVKVITKYVSVSESIKQMEVQLS